MKAGASLSNADLMYCLLGPWIKVFKAGKCKEAWSKIGLYQFMQHVCWEMKREDSEDLRQTVHEQVLDGASRIDWTAVVGFTHKDDDDDTRMPWTQWTAGTRQLKRSALSTPLGSGTRASKASVPGSLAEHERCYEEAQEAAQEKEVSSSNAAEKTEEKLLSTKENLEALMAIVFDKKEDKGRWCLKKSGKGALLTQAHVHSVFLALRRQARACAIWKA
eukprot:346061-Rhodomonas_salina.2